MLLFFFDFLSCLSNFFFKRFDPFSEFFSVNFKNYIIRRGETVVIPEELAEVIRNAELAEEYALKYADEKKLNEAK